MERGNAPGRTGHSGGQAPARRAGGRRLALFRFFEPKHANPSTVWSLSAITSIVFHLTPTSILREIFGYEAFRGPQADIVGHVTGGGDALVLMPTGGGKSLCYQIPAIARQQAGHGVTIVVSSDPE